MKLIKYFASILRILRPNRPKIREEVLPEEKTRSWLTLALVGNLEPCAQLLLQWWGWVLCTQSSILQPAFCMLLITWMLLEILIIYGKWKCLLSYYLISRIPGTPCCLHWKFQGIHWIPRWCYGNAPICITTASYNNNVTWKPW